MKAEDWTNRVLFFALGLCSGLKPRLYPVFNVLVFISNINVWFSVNVVHESST